VLIKYVGNVAEFQQRERSEDDESGVDRSEAIKRLAKIGADSGCLMTVVAGDYVYGLTVSPLIRRMAYVYRRIIDGAMDAEGRTAAVVWLASYVSHYMRTVVALGPEFSSNNPDGSQIAVEEVSVIDAAEVDRFENVAKFINVNLAGTELLNNILKSQISKSQALNILRGPWAFITIMSKTPNSVMSGQQQFLEPQGIVENLTGSESAPSEVPVLPDVKVEVGNRIFDRVQPVLNAVMSGLRAELASEELALLPENVQASYSTLIASMNGAFSVSRIDKEEAENVIGTYLAEVQAILSRMDFIADSSAARRMARNIIIESLGKEGPQVAAIGSGMFNRPNGVIKYALYQYDLMQMQMNTVSPSGALSSSMVGGFGETLSVQQFTALISRAELTIAEESMLTTPVRELSRLQRSSGVDGPIDVTHIFDITPASNRSPVV
jgi:hypothetical protein